MTSCQKTVDDLGWEASVTVSCLGVALGLRGKDRAAIDTLVGWLPRAARAGRTSSVPVLYSLILGGNQPGSKVRRFHILYRNFTRIGRSLDLEDVRRAFDKDLATFVGERSSRRVFVHAGVVGIGDAAVVIAGKSFSGKTTLTRALVEAGGVYYSDEFALLDAEGRVAPWAEPLSIRDDDRTRRSSRRSPHSLGFRSGRRLLPVKLVVLATFEAGKSFNLRPVPAGEGALGLLSNTLPARKQPRAALRAVSAVVSQAPVLQGVRGEARSAARSILRYLEPSGA